MTITLILTKDEASALARCLDVAVRTEGLKAAASVAVLFGKLDAAMAQADKEAENPSPPPTTP